MVAFVVQVDGYDPVAGAAVTLYASSVDDDRVCTGLNGQTWWPVIAALPKLRYDLVDAGFSGRIDTPSSSLALAVEPWPDFARYILADARVRLWSGEAGTAWGSWTLRFDGRATSQPAIEAGRAQLAIAVDDRWLDTPLLALYAGTTGVEGDSGIKGQPKPLALGAPRYCPPTLIDANNIVYQLSAGGLIEDIETAFEGLASFGASVGDYASYAALVAATVKAGQWATSKASGLVRHGAPPAPGRRFCYHVKGDKAGPDGWVRKPGSIIRRLALLAGGTGKTHDSSLYALDTSRPWNISFLAREQITARALIQRIAASVNAVAGVSWTGLLFAAPLPDLSGAATLTLDATGIALPPVAKVAQLAIDPPYWRMAIEAERTEDVHAYSDVAFTSVLVDRGAYDATQSYREGHIVQDQGTSWIYINPTPSVGNAPPTLPTAANSWWKSLSDASRDRRAYWKRSATQPATPTGNGMPAGWYDKPSFVWTPVLSAGMTASVSNTTFTKSSGTTAWNAGVRSTEAVPGDVSVSLKPSQTNKNLMFGLNSDPATDDNYTSIDFAVWVASDGNLYIDQNGSLSASQGTYTTSDTIGVSRTGNTVMPTKNGVQLGAITATIAAATALSLDSSFEGVGGAANSVAMTIGALAGTDPEWVTYVEQDQAGTTYGTFSAPVRFTDSEPFSDITKTVVGDAVSSVNALADGSFATGVLPKLVNFQLLKSDGTDITSTATWAAPVDSGGATASISIVSGKAQLSVSALPGTSKFTITATIGTIVVGVAKHTMTKVPPDPSLGATAGGGTSSSQVIDGTSGASSTYAAIAPVMTANAGTGGQVACVAAVEYLINSLTTDSATGTLVWRWRVVGGVFADIATAQGPGTASNRAAGADTTPGAQNVNMTKTGLTAGTAYEFQLFAKSNNSAKTIYCYGQGGANATATGS